MTSVHIVLGTALIAVNVAAGLYGLWAWWRGPASTPGFWGIVRTGQVLVALEAALGGVLVIAGRTLPSLHLIYGLTPLGVSLVAEQLRIASAQAVLDLRELPDAQAVGVLPVADQRAIVHAILRREQGVMGAAGFVIAALGARAAGLF